MLDSLSSLGTDVVVINLQTINCICADSIRTNYSGCSWKVVLIGVQELFEIGGCRGGRRLQRCSYLAKMYGCTKESKFKDLFSMFVYYELNVYHISYSEHYCKYSYISY